MHTHRVFLCLPCMRGRRAVRRAFKHRANHWYNESDSTEDDERTASAFRIGHRAGTAVLPPCSTPQQLTEHQNKNTRRGTAGAFILVVLMAQQLNTGNGDALRTIARMAQAIARKVTLDELTEEERDVMAHFKNPAMPSVAVTADAAIKIASARQEFAATDTFLEMIGFDQADIRRIRAQEQRVRGQQVLMEMENDADNSQRLE